MNKLLSTGSTLLNLAISGTPHGGLKPGHYYFLVGDSMSGKTFLSMTCFAESTIDPEFQNYRLIYDNVEDGMLMDADALFGEKTADRIEPPEQDKEGNAVYSSTIEEFYFHLADAFDQGKPFIYILDSMDGLDSEAAGAKFEKRRKAARKIAEGKEVEKVAGSFGDGKAKINSEYIRKAIPLLRESGSILIIISQTRDNIGMYGPSKTRSGGRALRFYATAEIWSSISESIKKQVLGKERVVGTRVKLHVQKNRQTGRNHSVEVDIFPDVGFDDIGACVDYLLEEGHWEQTKQTIAAKEFKIEGTRERIIKVIERRGLRSELARICGECWAKVIEASGSHRLNRYTMPPTEQDEK